MNNPYQLAEITGVAEQSVRRVDTRSAVELLDRLLDRQDAEWSSAALPTSERDRLLMAVYIQIFGDRIDSTVRCRSCEEPFDIGFSLRQLAQVAAPQLPDGISSLPDGTYRWSNGRFRLLTGADEIAVAGMPAAEAASNLRARCLLEGSGEGLEDVIETVAPILFSDLDARCPECGTRQQVEFDLQRYLLEALISGQSALTHEIHRIALAYGWSLTEILSLPRLQRRRFVHWIEAERKPRQ